MTRPRHRVPPWVWVVLAAVSFYPLIQLAMFALAAVAGVISLSCPIWGTWLLYRVLTDKPDPKMVAARKRIEEQLAARRRGEELLGIPHRPTAAEAARMEAERQEIDDMLRL